MSVCTAEKYVNEMLKKINPNSSRVVESGHQSIDTDGLRLIFEVILHSKLRNRSSKRQRG